MSDLGDGPIPPQRRSRPLIKALLGDPSIDRPANAALHYCKDADVKARRSLIGKACDHCIPSE